MYARYKIRYLGSIIIIGAYCVGKVQNTLPPSIIIIGAYCVGKVHNTLPR